MKPSEEVSQPTPDTRRRVEVQEVVHMPVRVNGHTEGKAYAVCPYDGKFLELPPFADRPPVMLIECSPEHLVVLTTKKAL